MDERKQSLCKFFNLINAQIGDGESGLRRILRFRIQARGTGFKRNCDLTNDHVCLVLNYLFLKENGSAE